MLAITEIATAPGPSSQLQSTPIQTQKAVFVDTHGSPLHVFVEASSIYGRPRIVRTIRTYGGVITHKPETAQIILVNSESLAGQEMAKEWGQGQAQVVLDAEWAFVAVNKGSAPLWYDNWGGFRTTGEVKGEVDENEINQPLPTPRQTPVESTQVDRRPVGRPVPSSQLSSSRPSTTHSGPLTPSQLPPDPIPSPPVVSPPTQLTMQNGVPLQQSVPSSTTWVPNLAATIVDVIKFQHGLANPMSMFVPQVSPGPFPLFPPTQPPVAQTIPQVSPVSPAPQTSSVDQEQYSIPDTAVLTPSLKRRLSPETPHPSSLPQRGKDDIIDESPRPLKQQRLSSEPRSSLPPSSEASKRDSPFSATREVFITDDGGPLHFVVQIDIRNRKEVVAMIKKGGGKICAEISQADYVVLSPHSTSFTDLLNSCGSLEKPAVNAHFVHDCMERNELLDDESYGFEGVIGKRGRGRPVSTATPKKAPVSSERTKIPDKPKPSPKARKSKPSLVKDDFDLPLPTPVPSAPGKFLFTTEEMDYFEKYANYLLKANPHMSNVQIGQKMHEKMPQHPISSWSLQTSKKKDLLKEIRRQVAAGLEAAKKTPTKEPPTAPEPLPEPETPAAAPVNTITLEDLKATKEFIAITGFLGKGGADGIADEDVWPVLHEKHPFLSPEQWATYWETYGEHICEVVTEMLAGHNQEPQVGALQSTSEIDDQNSVSDLQSS